MMTRIRQRFSPALIALALFLAAATTLAATAQSYLEAKQKELTTLIKAPRSASTDKQLKSTFDQLLDYDALSKSSLGPQWDNRSDAERQEFQALLTTLVQSAYTKNIRSTLDYNITFEGSAPAKEGQLVKTIAKHKTDARKEVIHIHYLVHSVAGKWRVYDIITEGSSLVGNYKNQFRRIIDKNGFADLLARMRKKAKAES